MSRPDAGPAAPLAAALAFGAGLIVATQALVNGELGQRTGSAVWAALVSFGSGLVLVAVLVAALPGTRRAVAARPARLPWWTYLGGIGGATLVVVTAAAVPQIGVAMFTVGLVAGQALGGLLVDRSRLTPGAPRPLSATRVLGAALAVLAVVVIRLGHDSGPVGPGTVLVLLLAAAAAGLGTSVQQALNGRVQRSAGHPLLATLGNFLVGTAALAVAFLVAALAGAGPDRYWPGGAGLYVGGALGVVFISIAAWTVWGLGVLRLGLLAVAGQLAGGLLLDLVSPGRTGGVAAATVAGVLLTLAGVALAGRTRPAPAAGPAGDRAAPDAAGQAPGVPAAGPAADRAAPDAAGPAADRAPAPDAAGPAADRAPVPDAAGPAPGAPAAGDSAAGVPAPRAGGTPAAGPTPSGHRGRAAGTMDG